MKIRDALLFIILSLTDVAIAGTGIDLGSIGQTYEIAEPDLLERMYAKLNEAKDNGELAKIETDMKNRFIDYAHRPPGMDLPRTKVNKLHYFDPTIQLADSIKDHEGNVLWPAGTRVNPLEHITLSQQWLFFNADDPDQVAWAKAYVTRYPERVRLILTQGEVLQLMKDWNRRVYFDQGGRLVKRFGIETLPSLISQEGKRLRIDAIVPEVAAHG